MDWKKFTLIIIGFVLLIYLILTTVFSVKYFSIKSLPIHHDTTTVHDTSYIPANPIIKHQVKYIQVTPLAKTITIKDTLSGMKNLTKYMATYEAIIDSDDTAISMMDVVIEPVIMFITQLKTVEVPKIEFQSEPFYDNEFFWVSIGEAIIILYTIYKLVTK